MWVRLNVRHINIWNIWVHIRYILLNAWMQVRVFIFHLIQRLLCWRIASKKKGNLCFPSVFMLAIIEPWVERPELETTDTYFHRITSSCCWWTQQGYDNISHAEWDVNQHTHNSFEDPSVCPHIHTHTFHFHYLMQSQHSNYMHARTYDVLLIDTLTRLHNHEKSTFSHAPSFRSVCVYTHKTTDAGRHAQTATSYFGCDKVQTTWTPTMQLVVWMRMAARKSITTWSLFLNKFCGFCSCSLFTLNFNFPTLRTTEPKV